MTEVPKIVPTLTGGVSQQPPALRFPGQVEDAENTLLSLVDGAAKRPPTNHVAELVADLEDNSAYHLIERDGTDYVLVLSDLGPSITKPGIRVFDLLGAEQTVLRQDLSPAYEIPTHYTGSSPGNYLGDWQQPGIASGWTTSVGADEAGAAVTAEAAPLAGYLPAVELWDINDGGVGLWAHEVDTAFGARSTVVSIYAKKNEGAAQFALEIRNGTTQTTYSAVFAWSGSALVTSGTPNTGTAYVESIGSGWYRAIYVVDASIDVPDVGDRVFFVQLAIDDGSSENRDYYWGMALNHVDDATATVAPPIVDGFGPFRFLTIADATFVLNTSWQTRLAAPANQTRQEWLDGLLDVADEVLKVGVVWRTSSTYAWSITNSAGTHSGTTASGYPPSLGVPGSDPQNIVALLEQLVDDIIAESGTLAGTTYSVAGKRLEIRSTTPITAFSFTPVLMNPDLETIEDTLLLSVQDALGSTDYDWEVVNQAGTFSGTVNIGGSPTATAIATAIAADIAGADASLVNTTSDGSLVEIKSSTEITSSTFTADILLSYEPILADVCYLFVQQGSETKTYSWEITNGSGTFSDDFLATDSDTTSIAGSIATQIAQADLSLRDTIAVGSIIEVRSISEITDFETTDDGADTLLVAWKDEVDTLADLPVNFRDGYRIRVSVDPTTELEDYFAVFRRTSDDGLGFGPGVWAESSDWGSVTGFDQGSMPHQLQLHTDDESGTATGTAFATYFTWGPVDWVDREVGDDTLNRAPSFVGETIGEIFFHANRLGFLSGQNAILSEAGIYFNFWRTTVISLPESDRIDVAANEPKLAVFKAAGALAEQLIISSSQAQFVLEGQPLTPQTAIINKISSFRVSNLRPPLLGRSLLFPTPGAEYAGAQEFYRSDEGAFKADEVTQPVPKYIEGNVVLAESHPLETIVFLKAGSARTLYVYKHARDGDRRVQAAWSRWTFGPSSEVAHLDFLEGQGVLLIKRGDALNLETIEVGDGLVDEGQALRVMLDRRVRDTDCTLVYSALNDKTTITLPYDLDPLIVAAGVGVATLAGVELIVDSIGTDSIVVVGDHTATEFWAGERYTQTLTLTEPVPQRQGPDGPIPRSGHYQVQNVEIQVAGTGAFEARVTPKDYDETFVHEFTPQIVGAADSDAGELALFTGIRQVAIMAPAPGLRVQLTNSSASPSRFTGLVWNGDLSAFRPGA